MFDGIELAAMIGDVCRLHQLYPKQPYKAYRKSPPNTAYGIHPVFLCTLILQEEKLTEETRVIGAKALLGHDLDEDTTAPLPGWCKNPPEVLEIIKELSFDPGVDQLAELWKRSERSRLFKFYDVTGNLLAVSHLKPERVLQRQACALRLLEWIEPCYPGLEISKIARGLLGLGPH